MKFKSEIQLEALNNATVDTDKFLVSDSTTVKYRTGAQLLSDLGVSGLFVPYTGAIGNVDLGTHTLLAKDLIINHSSGSGVAASITKNGSGEALTIIKGSGSGNAMSVTGGLTSLVNLSLSTVANATGDFLTHSGSTIHKRTPAQVLSDIGGQAALTNPITGTGTTNYVSKFTGATSLGNSQIFDNGTNVGIGTTSPTAKLDVHSVIRATNTSSATFQSASLELFTFNGSSVSSGTSLFSTNNNFNYGTIVSNQTNLYGIRSGGIRIATEIAPIIFSNGNSDIDFAAERMRITANGNVGIGTTAPSEKLEVQNGPAGAKIKVGNSAGGFASLECSSNASSVAQLTFTNQLSLIGGNVGIGTTSPQRPLEVITAVRITGTAPTIDFGSDFDNQIWANSTALNIKAGGTERITINKSTGNVGIGTTSPGARLHVVGEGVFDDGVNGRLTFGNASGQNDIYSTTTSFGAWKNLRLSSNELILSTGGTNERMRITSSGNVGIGTTAPTQKLEINDGNIQVNRSYPFLALKASGWSSNSFIQVGTNLTIDDGGDYMTIRNPSGKGIAFQRGGVTDMIINPSGNVGIGTTSPSYPLHVASNIGGVSIYANNDIVAFSDQSVKENIRPIENVIERIRDSRGVLYDRTDNGEKNNIGFIAQELEVAFPELVVTNPDGTKAVKYQNAVAVLFEAVKEQQKQIDEIKQILNGITK
jgi:hypothetical protein